MVKKSLKEKSPPIDRIEHVEEEEEEELVDVGPYQCVGNFKDDFEALCREAKLVYIPRVIPRPHLPLANLSQTPSTEERNKSVRLSRKEMRSVASCRPDSVLTSPLTGNGPKTFLISSSRDYFYPSIQVESSDPEKLDEVTGIYIKNWLVDKDMMMILYQSLSMQSKLSLISFWRVGLNAQTLVHLSCLVYNTPSLKTLILDNNPIESQDWHVLIKEPSPIQHLSLRFNEITPDGCHKLACVLSVLNKQSSSKLLSLNLSGNRVTDDGAELLANGLKFNSSLLFLDLSNNCIGNYGTKKLAQAISKFPLSHNETVARRQFIWDALVRTTENKNTEEVAVEEVNNQDQRSRSSLRTSKQIDPKAAKETSRKSKKKESTSESKDARRSKLQESLRDSKQEQKEQDNEMPSDIYGGLPNLAFTEFNHDEGPPYMRGNLTLVSLNLSHNPIDEKGLCHLLSALNMQAEITSQSQNRGQSSAACKGLLRLQANVDVYFCNVLLHQKNGVLKVFNFLQGNLACPTSEVVRQIERIMKDKHPFQTTTPEPN